MASISRFFLADMSELNLPRNATIEFPEGKDKIMHFEVTLRPEEGLYKYVPR